MPDTPRRITKVKILQDVFMNSGELSSSKAKRRPHLTTSQPSPEAKPIYRAGEIYTSPDPSFLRELQLIQAKVEVIQ